MAETQGLYNRIADIADGESRVTNLDNYRKHMKDGLAFAITSTITCTNAAHTARAIFVKNAASTKARTIIFDVSADKQATIYIYENSYSSGGGGTTQTPVNLNRMSTKASDFKVRRQHTTKSSESLTLLATVKIPSTLSAAVRAGGNYNTRDEFILAPNKNYTILGDPDISATKFVFNARWYES